jgi:hypothetical protein
MSLESRGMVHVFYLLGKPTPPISDQPQLRNTNTPISDQLHLRNINDPFSNQPQLRNTNSFQSNPNHLVFQPKSPAPPYDPPCCGCRKSQCIQLKCACFRKKAFCKSNCLCDGCCNKEATRAARDDAIRLTSQIFNNAFNTPEVIPLQNTKIVSIGCNCKKSSCNKKYCPCFRQGADCSNLCKCLQCSRQKVTIDPKRSPEIFGRQKNRRKRLRVVCSENRVELRKYPKVEIFRLRDVKSRDLTFDQSV